MTASVRFARKAVDAGADAVVAEGFEAGGHNGREETTTLVLIPLVRDAVHVPVIAAGGIADGRAMLAAMALGADGVQVGSRFVASEESSAHPAFKQHVIDSKEGDTLQLDIDPQFLWVHPAGRELACKAGVVGFEHDNTDCG